MFSKEDLRPYKDIGNGLYELPGYIICNKKGLDEYINHLKEQGLAIEAPEGMYK